jgi:hypothetical protein
MKNQAAACEAFERRGELGARMQRRQRTADANRGRGAWLADPKLGRRNLQALNVYDLNSGTSLNVTQKPTPGLALGAQTSDMKRRVPITRSASAIPAWA